MSLLDRDAPHYVRVQTRVVQRDEGGRAITVNSGEPVGHRCAVQVARDWSSAEEQMTAGLQVLDMRVIYSRQWSGDELAHIHIPDEALEPGGTWETYDGTWSLYEMVGAPQPLRMSRRTSHWRVTCRRVGTLET